MPVMIDGGGRIIRRPSPAAEELKKAQRDQSQRPPAAGDAKGPAGDAARKVVKDAEAEKP